MKSFQHRMIRTESESRKEDANQYVDTIMKMRADEKETANEHIEEQEERTQRECLGIARRGQLRN